MIRIGGGGAAGVVGARGWGGWPVGVGSSIYQVKVLAGKDKQWEKQIKEFEKDFLGKDIITEEVKILNREVIDFEYGKPNSGYYKAKANEPLIIENRSLGYRVTYILESFKRTSETLYYQGISRFEILVPKYEYEASSWRKNQNNAYKGSLPHFLKAMVTNKLKEEGFDAFFINPNYKQYSFQKIKFYDSTNNRHIPFSVSEIVNPLIENSSLFEITWKLPMEVVYTKKPISKPVFPDAPYPFSTLTPKANVVITSNGNLIEPFSIEISGEMANNGVAKLLPLDFESK
ncbi:MAG: hypothetical protein U5N85_06350 [Arcicella sp.]|nr:hypothetical protein [Arcicella sp.]